MGQETSPSGSDGPCLELSSRCSNYLRKVRLIWIIDNFLKLMKCAAPKNSYLKSKKYYVPVHAGDDVVEELKIALRVDWNTARGEILDANFVGLYVKAPTGSNVIHTFHLRKRDGSACFHTRSDFSIFKGLWRGSPRVCRKRVLKTGGEELLPGGALTVVCDLEIMCEHPQYDEHPELPGVEREADAALGMGLKQIPTGPGDVRLWVGQDCVPCHKYILQARSDVFATMLALEDMSESVTGSVHIKDMSLGALKQFVNFLYLGRLEDFSQDSLLELLVAGEKYNVQLLKSLCQRHLLKQVRMDNVSLLCSVAQTYRAAELLSATIRFIAANAKEVTESAGWDQVPAEVAKQAFVKVADRLP